MNLRTIRTIGIISITMAWLGGCDRGPKDTGNPQPSAQPATTQPEASSAQPPAGLVALELLYAKPQFVGTPKGGFSKEVEALPEKPRPRVFAPAGTVNLSKGRPVTGSDSSPTNGSLDMVTDGDKEAMQGSEVELSIGKQWVQIDLGQPSELHSILVWHQHKDARAYKDAIVQVSADADFIGDVQTLFNNDRDNSTGLGLGTDREYLEHWEGKLIDGKSATGRHVRLWSNGSTSDDQNHYIEVEVWGKPVK